MADQIGGSILDAGCGTGENALWLASRGKKVTGIDFVEAAIQRAQQKAQERGLSATFIVKDALALKGWSERFDNVIDSGLFHVFSDEDRRRYVEGLGAVLKPGGRLFLLTTSDAEPVPQGRKALARRVSAKEIQETFAAGWRVESIEPTRIEVRPGLQEGMFSEGGPKAWFAIVRRGDN